MSQTRDYRTHRRNILKGIFKERVITWMNKKGKSKSLQMPVRHLDLKGAQSLFDLAQTFEHTSFQSRNVYKCFEVYRKMLRDPPCVIFLGLSGAMIPGGMRKVFGDMIEMRLVDVIVFTGANIFHDIFESSGYRHYIGSEVGDDDALRKHGIVRVYDALMDDDRINQVIQLLSKAPDKLGEKVVSSRRYLEVLGSRIKDEGSILKAASRFGVPIFVPALSDSSIGIGLTFFHARKKNHSDGLVIDQIRDTYEIAQLKRMASATGAIYIGGGVPKNYIQQRAQCANFCSRRTASISMHYRSPRMIQNGEGSQAVPLKRRYLGGRSGRTHHMRPSIQMRPLLLPCWLAPSSKKGRFIGKGRGAVLYGRETD